MNNTDLSPSLQEEMIRQTHAVGGLTLYTAPIRLHNEVGAYLYRSMPLEEARIWFTAGFFNQPNNSTSWSTDWEYSRSYLIGAKCEKKKNFRVQLEVPAHDVLNRLQAIGAMPKYESTPTGEEAATWGTGRTEIGRKANNEQNAGLHSLYLQRQADLMDTSLQNLSKKQALNTRNAKEIQNALFRTMFKDKVPLARVVARLVG